jgi:hypothetical protein
MNKIHKDKLKHIVDMGMRLETCMGASTYASKAAKLMTLLSSHVGCANINCATNKALTQVCKSAIEEYIMLQSKVIADDLKKEQKDKEIVEGLLKGK